MMSAVNGHFNGKNIVLDEEVDLQEGQKVIITIINDFHTETSKPVDLSQFVTPTERGRQADKYIQEMRKDDRL